MRSLGRGLALLLVVGAVLSAVTGDGFARVLGAISGYADFGYAPEACGTSTSVARAINGEKVRVCQDTYSTTSGFFAGHELTGVGYAFADLRVSLPDQQVVYSCCNAQENWFSDAIFEPLVPGAGTIHSDAGTFVRVAQTARPTASGYTVVYAITNLTQSPLHVRPAASMSGYYWDTPVVTQTGAPLALNLRQPDMGGSVTLAESDLEGSPTPTSYSAGSRDRIDATVTAAGQPLDNTLHDDLADGGDLAQMAIAWPAVQLAGGATARYSVAVTLEQNREVQLKLAGALPSAAAPTQLAASVTDDRPLAGGLLRWTMSRHGMTEGSASLDAAGHGVISLPAGAGEGRVSAYFDANRNGDWDEDEPATYGWVYAPGARATSTPTPAPPVAAPVRIAVPAPPIARPAPFTGPSPNQLIKIPFKRTYKVKGCTGKASLQLLSGKKLLAKKSVKFAKGCKLDVTFSIKAADMKKLTVVVSFHGKKKTFRV